MNPIIAVAVLGWLSGSSSEEDSYRRRKSDKEFKGHHLPGPCG